MHDQLRQHQSSCAAVSWGVVLLFLSGCINGQGSLGTEEVAVVTYTGAVVDLQSPKPVSLIPMLESMIGEDTLSAYVMPNSRMHLYGVVPSPGGRYLALRDHEGRSLCIVDLLSRSAAIVDSTKGYEYISLGGWSPDGNSLLCLASNADKGQFKGHLFVLKKSAKSWSWRKLEKIGDVSARRASDALTEGCWFDQWHILFADAGRIKRYDLRQERLDLGPKGDSAYSFGNQRVLFRPQAGPSTGRSAFFAAAWPLDGKLGASKEMRGNGIVMNCRPICSPAGHRVLFNSEGLVGLHGHAAIRTRLCMYDAESDRFEVVHERSKYAELIDAAYSGVWITDRHGLKEAAKTTNE